MKRLHWPSVAVAWMSLGLLLAMALAAQVQGQEADASGPFDLVGIVVDDAGRPLVGAFVSLEDSDWGSISTDAGRFEIPSVTPGTVSLEVELLGYETLHWTGSVRESRPLSLTLAPRPIVLEGLNVVTSRFESRRKATGASVRWFDRADLVTSVSNDVIDFVATRAGLSRTTCRSVWDDECFMVRGRAVAPEVWIDEAPVVGGMDYLRTVRPYELYMVEVYAGGRQIRAYTPRFMERAAKTRLQPIAFVF